MVVRLVSSFLILLAGAASPTSAAPAQLNNGDLIFQESQSGQSSAVLAATGSKFTHMGIVILDGRSKIPLVVEASAHVRTIPLQRWIGQGKGGRYAVYRLQGLSPANGLQVEQAALSYLGKPYDIFFRFGDDQIYCSELALLAFRKIGIELGKIETIGELNASAPQVRTLFLKRWKQHPDCRIAKTSDDCWQTVLKQQLVTPASIASDKRLSQITSNF